MHYDDQLRALLESGSSCATSCGDQPGNEEGVGEFFPASPCDSHPAGWCEPSSLKPVSARPYLAYARKGQGPGRKRAGKAYSEHELAHVLARIDALSAVPESDAVKVLTTYRAGLRPCEVAGLTKRTLLTATGEVSDVLEIMPSTSKRSKPRSVPMHPQLKTAVERLFIAHPKAERVAFSAVKNGDYRYQTACALYLWYAALYRGAGFNACTGMSGRHSFATNLARFAPLPLVQKALGHASLRTTGIYITPSGDLAAAIRKLGKS